MKRLSIALVVLAAALLGGFFLLLSGSGADNAPKDVIVVDLPDVYEK